jgi:hypothetical protein
MSEMGGSLSLKHHTDCHGLHVHVHFTVTAANSWHNCNLTGCCVELVDGFDGSSVSSMPLHVLACVAKLGEGAP